MKLAWLSAVILTGCISFGGDDEGGDDMPCTGSQCGGSGSGSGSGGSDCDLVEDDGPGGHLADYEVTAQSEWILTREEDRRSALWERTPAGWQARPLGAACLDGLLAVSESGAVAVACSIRNGGATDLKLFEIGSSVTSVLVYEGQTSDLGGWVRSKPLAFAYDSSNRPSILYKIMIDQQGGSVSVYGGGLVRRGTNGWTDAFYETVLPDDARLVAFGGELLVALNRPQESIALLHASALSPMAELDVSASSFEVIGDQNGVHVAAADDTGKVRYFRRGEGSQLATVVGDGEDVSISLDPQGEPVLAFAVDGSVHLAHRSGLTWSSDRLGDSEGSRPIVRFGTSGKLRVAYQDDALDQVVVVREECR